MLIGSGLDVVFVSRQLGHANPNVTLRVYAHVFAQAAPVTRLSLNKKRWRDLTL